MPGLYYYLYYFIFNLGKMSFQVELSVCSNLPLNLLRILCIFYVVL